MSKIILTGASGLLGSEMINLLKKENINHISIKSRIENLDNNLSKIEEFDPDIFFHFGALKTKKFLDNEAKREIYESNVTLTNELFNYCKRNNIKFIYISTADLYKRYGKPSFEIDNLSQSQSTITGGFYGWTRYLGEDLLKKEKGDHLIFRSSTIYNNIKPHNFSCAKLLKSKNFIKNFVFDDKQYSMNFVRADFFASAILEISKKKKTISNIYNFTSSFWFDNFAIFNLYAKKHDLSLLKNGQKKVMSKRFNASNSLIKRELGIKFKESNYLQDLSFYLASLDIGDN